MIQTNDHIIKVYKTKTGWKFDFAVKSKHMETASKMTILCSRRPDYIQAITAAENHVKTHLINFERWGTEQEAEQLKTK